MANYISKLGKYATRALRTAIVKLTRNYKTKLHSLSIREWFQLQNESDYTVLYRWKWFAWTPAFFEGLYEDMIYQFDRLDLTLLRMLSQHEYLKARYAITGKSHFENKRRVKEVEIENVKAKHRETIKLNDFVDFIELSFEQINSINPDKMDAARAFSLYWKAVDLNERKQQKKQQHGGNR